MFWGIYGIHLLLLPFLLFGRLFWLVIPALLIWALLRAFSARNRSTTYFGQGPYSTPGMPPFQPSAMEILRQRYARGEIDAATFEQMRERLEASGGYAQQAQQSQWGQWDQWRQE